MPIHVGGERLAANAAAELDAGDGEALYNLLAREVREMSAGEQTELVLALQAGTAWSSLAPRLQARFEDVASEYVDGEGS